MKNSIFSSFLIALGLVGLGFMVKLGITNFKEMDRVVYVKGLSEKQVEANKVTWPLGFYELGNNVLSLYENINKKNKVITDFLIENGLSKDEISINPPQITDMKASTYSNKEAVSYRYHSSSLITVSSSKVKLVRDLILKQTELLKKGIVIIENSYNNSIEYSFTGLNKIKPVMIEEATKNARNAAIKFAKDSESQLGKIKSAYQGQFSIRSRDANTPYIKNVRVVTTIQYYLRN